MGRFFRNIKNLFTFKPYEPKKFPIYFQIGDGITGFRSIWDAIEHAQVLIKYFKDTDIIIECCPPFKPLGSDVIIRGVLFLDPLPSQSPSVIYKMGGTDSPSATLSPSPSPSPEPPEEK